jgi:thiosulfate/3-mercaptopyruvate sulfurtransferase
VSEPSPLITAAELALHVEDPDWCIVDCRFALNDTDRGRRDYAASHMPNSVYAHLDNDLSGPVVAGETGRHPLPRPESFAASLEAWGIDPDVSVVVYDDCDASISARLWWMLRWVGHRRVSVLDGGWAAWIEMGGQTTDEPGRRQPRVYQADPDPSMLVGCGEVEEIRCASGWLLIDSRTAERFRGESEPIDPVAGHIPGAINAAFTANLDAQGRLLSAATLRSRFTEILGAVEPEQAVFYCGSGVTAAHNLLALAVAGIEGARLYPGSWSEWIADPRRAVARGAL